MRDLAATMKVCLRGFRATIKTSSHQRIIGGLFENTPDGKELVAAGSSCYVQYFTYGEQTYNRESLTFYSKMRHSAQSGVPFYKLIGTTWTGGSVFKYTDMPLKDIIVNSAAINLPEIITRVPCVRYNSVIYSKTQAYTGVVTTAYRAETATMAKLIHKLVTTNIAKDIISRPYFTYAQLVEMLDSDEHTPQETPILVRSVNRHEYSLVIQNCSKSQTITVWNTNEYRAANKALKIISSGDKDRGKRHGYLVTSMLNRYRANELFTPIANNQEI